jgi:hypothetical protein
MRIYLALSSRRNARPWCEEVVAPEITEILWPAVAGPWRSSRWSSRDGLTQLLVWSNEPEDDPRYLPALDSDAEGALGCPGYLGCREDARRLLAASDVGAAADALPGVFGVFRGRQDGFEAVTTAVRLHPVYHASGGGTEIASNRALLAHIAARALDPSSAHGLRYDVVAIHSLVRNGYFVSDETPFAGVQALPAHASLVVQRGERRIETRKLPRARSAPDTGPGWRARGRLMERLVKGLVEAASPLRAFPAPVALSLTGGRDSRLVAAVLHAAGLPFRALTYGFPDHPDVILAARIARLLGVEHSVREPARVAETGALRVAHPLDRAREIVRATEGMVSAHNNIARLTPFQRAPNTSGFGGEQLRGGFLAGHKEIDPDALRRRVRNLFLGHKDVMTDAANERARADLAPWAKLARRDPLLALDRLYLYYRTGRWSAASRAPAMVGNTSFNLLVDNALNRRALALPLAWRWSERPVHAAISRLAPCLRDVPLTKNRWRYESQPPWLFRARWRARAPVAVDPTGSGFDWRNALGPELLAPFREEILDGPAALFDLVQRARVEQLLASEHPTKAESIFLWNVYTAAVLLSGAWLAAAPGRPEIHIAVR